MENKRGIFVVKRLHFSNILDYIWTSTLHLKKSLGCVWTWTKLKKTGLDVDCKIGQSAYLCWKLG